MLYIFSVEQGNMLTFDMDYACESVSQLKEIIEQTQSIPVDKQVLLISGGESLSPQAAVSSYGSGTDTNPIFLFNKKLHELQDSTSPEVKRHNPHSDKLEATLRRKLDTLRSQEYSLNTLRTCTSFAQDLLQLSQEEAKLCKERIHEQHLQQQAWSAVIANLEDAMTAFKAKASGFTKTYENFLSRQDQFASMLEAFPEDSKMLARVPLLDKLTKVIAENQSPTPETHEGPSTLLDYVLRSDPNGSLENLAERCARGLQQINPEMLTDVKISVDELVSRVEKPQFKQIRGLEKRLSGLEELQQQAEQLVAEQEALFQQFPAGYTKATKLKESERLQLIPELCSSLVREVDQLFEKYFALKDIARRCASAKDELSENLKVRLNYITRNECQVAELSLTLTAYERKIQSLARDMSKVEQIHSAPQVYARSLAEVVRRKQFSNLFLKWAGSLSTHCTEVYRQEVEYRRTYNAQIRSHFLRSLFPGLDDLPPAFATRNPRMFDDRLPNVEMSDVEALKRTMPPDLVSLLDTSGSVPSLSFMDVDSHMSSDISKKADSDTISHQGVRMFEINMASSPTDPGYVTDNSNNVAMETAAEANAMSIEVDEREKLRACMAGLKESVEAFACDATGLVEEFTRFKGEVVGDTNRVASTFVEILGRLNKEKEQLHEQLEIERHKFTDAQSEIEIYYDQLRQMKELLESAKLESQGKELEYRSTITNLELQHELDLEQLQSKQSQLAKEFQVQQYDAQHELRALRRDRDELQRRMQQLQAEFEQRLAQMSDEYQKRELAVREELERQHKSDIEGLRCRYRLTASVISDSGTSPPAASPSHNFEARWKQKELELLKKYATLEEVFRERNDASAMVSSMETESSSQTPLVGALGQSMVESQYRIMSDSVSSQLMMDSTLRLQSPNANSEQIAAELVEQIRAKEVEIQKLQIQMALTCGMGSISSLGCDRISILTCCRGDTVLLTYDDTYENYVIFMLGPMLHFLHKDSLRTMGLSTVRENVTRSWIIGQVVDREYCEARRETNRYKVSVGTRFLRVKVRPWDRAGAVKREQERRQALRAALAAASASSLSSSSASASATSSVSASASATSSATSSSQAQSNIIQTVGSPVSSPATSI